MRSLNYYLVISSHAAQILEHCVVVHLLQSACLVPSPAAHPVPDDEIKRGLIVVWKNDPLLHGRHVEFEVGNGMVSVRAIFHDPEEVLRFKWAAARIEGIVTLSIRADFVV